MPTEKSSSRSYRFANRTIKQIEKASELLEMTDTQILEHAVAHLLYTLESDDPRLRLTPQPKDEKGHKRPPQDAA